MLPVARQRKELPEAVAGLALEREQSRRLLQLGLEQMVLEPAPQVLAVLEQTVLQLAVVELVVPEPGEGLDEPRKSAWSRGQRRPGEGRSRRANRAGERTNQP